MLLHLRSEIADGPENSAGPDANSKPKLSERTAFRAFGIAWRSPLIYRLWIRVGRLMQGVLISRGKVRSRAHLLSKGATPIRAWTYGRDAASIAPRSFREIWKAEFKKKRNDNAQ